MIRTMMILAITAITIHSCHSTDEKQSISTSHETAIDKAPGSCAYLTRDSKNNVVLSWVKEVDAATKIFCYAISDNNGETFGKAIEIAGSTNVDPHGENMPKVIFKPSGEIIAAWGVANPNPKNKYSGLIYYSQSFDDGSTWSKPKNITADTASFDQRYFDLALLPDGEAGIIWLDNRKQWKTEGSGLYYAVTAGKNGFQNEKLVSGPCCQCCRTDLFIDKDQNIHVLYRAIINDNTRDMVHMLSTDNGRNFTSPKRISNDDWKINGCPHTGPAMAENKNGIHFTWFTGGEDAGIYYNNSNNKGNTFSKRNIVSGKSSKHCQITSLPNNHIIIVWNESFPNKNTFNNRIGLEVRDATGKRVSKQYLTTESSNSSFPVIQPIDANNIVIAYTETIGETSRVMFKKIYL